MALETDLNVSPYFDDYSERKDFYKIILELDPSYEVEKFIGNNYAMENPCTFLDSFSNKEWANEKREDLGNKTLVEYA